MLITRLIDRGKATLHELRTVYTLDDVVYLNEVLDFGDEVRRDK